MRKSTTTGGNVLATARVQWHLGEWDALAAIRPGASGPKRREQERAELFQHLLQGALQTGRTDVARQALTALRQAGVDRNVLLRNLVSSAFNSAGRGWLAIGNLEKAEQCIRHSVGLFPDRGEESLVSDLRLSRQIRDAVRAGAPVPHRTLSREDRRLFIDCGGYDGCSVLKFLMTNPHYDCVTFEPNPELWKYYEDIPTRLIRKAVYTYDGEIDFIVDPVDGDGSSIFADKRIDFTQQVKNEDCPVISTPCADLSAFVRTAAETYGTIVLKLDVEGAEYDILEKMIAEGTIAHVDQLKCEFHGHKMGLDPERHERIVAEARKYCPVEEWDAIAFSMNWSQSKQATTLRRSLIKAVQSNRDTFRDVAEGGSF